MVPLNVSLPLAAAAEKLPGVRVAPVRASAPHASHTASLKRRRRRLYRRPAPIR
jgi:hypothetical protein